MNKMIFVTSNRNKFLTLQNKLVGVNVCLENIAIDLVEPQTNSIKDVAKFKAIEAFKQLHTPVLVHDSGMTIPVLNDFPGPYTKYISETIGNDGILNLLKPYTDKTAFLEQTFCYTDGKNIKCFSDRVRGHIIFSSNTIQNCSKWGKIWDIFAPGDQDTPRSAMTDKQYFELRPQIQTGDAWQDLIAFLGHLHNNTEFL